MNGLLLDDIYAFLALLPISIYWFIVLHYLSCQCYDLLNVNVFRLFQLLPQGIDSLECSCFHSRSNNCSSNSNFSNWQSLKPLSHDWCSLLVKVSVSSFLGDNFFITPQSIFHGFDSWVVILALCSLFIDCCNAWANISIGLGGGVVCWLSSWCDGVAFFLTRFFIFHRRWVICSIITHFACFLIRSRLFHKHSGTVLCCVISAHCVMDYTGELINQMTIV